MSKYITRDKLTDFVEKMWDAGMRTELMPERSRILVYDSKLNIQYVEVFSEQSYDGIVESLIEKKGEE